jgi:hypothetical protein
MERPSTLLIPIGIAAALVGLIPIPGTGFAFALLLVIAGVALRSLGH